MYRSRAAPHYNGTLQLARRRGRQRLACYLPLSPLSKARSWPRSAGYWTHRIRGDNGRGRLPSARGRPKACSMARTRVWRAQRPAWVACRRRGPAWELGALNCPSLDPPWLLNSRSAVRC